MILFADDFQKERAGIHYDTNNKSFIRITMVLKKLGISNYLFPLALYQSELNGIDPHNLKDNSTELRLKIAVEALINPFYCFREIIRLPASGGDPIPIEANRACIAMIWCFFNNISYIAIQPRQTGKAQSLEAKIKTPTGWTRMGDIKTGDEVTAPDGTTTTVTGVYPQGLKRMYRVIFEDDRATSCCEEHLWKIYNRYWRPDSEQWRVLSLAQIMERMARCPNTEAGLFVPLITPEEKPDIELPLDPYVVGAILGDGGLTTGTVRFSNADPFVIEELQKYLPCDVKLNHIDGCDHSVVDRSVTPGHRSPFRDILRSLGMLGKHSYEKTIPYQYYINASEKQRLSLLQGLMDTDGTVDDSGSGSFCTTSLVMASQVQYIVRSLGGLCKIRRKEPTYTYNGECRKGRITYIVRIRLNNPRWLFRLPRKRDKLPENYKSENKLKLGIKSIEYLGYQEAQCIEVDHPDHLYITDDFIVTHNTIMACSIMAYVMYIYGRNIEMSLYTKDSDLVQANVARIKTIRDALPKYLIYPQIKDIDNKEGLSYERLGNKYLTKIARADRQGADNTGRGITTPVVHGDEPAFCTNIDITYPSMMKSTLAAIANAKARGQPHSNILTTTAAPIDTARGKYVFDMVNRAMPFTEKLYDLRNKEELQQIVRANSGNELINGTFSYLMLGKTKEWYDYACRISETTKEVNDRELLNMWTAGTETGIIDPETLRIINAHRHEPEHTEIIQDYIVKWYITEAFLRSNAFLQRRYVLGMDSSENIGQDFTTLVMIDVSDMAVVCTFRCNESNTIKMGMFIAEFLIKYPNVTFVPERNSTGGAIIDVITLIFQKNRINAFRRIFNQVVQNKTDPEMARISIDDPDNIDTTIKKHLGFRTTTKTRPFLYKNTLKKAASLNATRIYDIALVSELSALSAVKGRIDHVEGGHDDLVIAYLLCCWFIFFGKNLQYYGIDVRSILMNVTSDGATIDPVHRDRQLELRRSIRYYEEMIETTPSPILKNTYRQKILLLQNDLDTSINVEPIGVETVSQDVKDYGKTIYTPQEFARTAKSNTTAEDNIRRLLKLIH